jgi:hypothetical protein
MRSCRRELATKGNLGEAEGATSCLLLNVEPDILSCSFPKVHGCAFGSVLTLTIRMGNCCVKLVLSELAPRRHLKFIRCSNFTQTNIPLFSAAKNLGQNPGNRLKWN